MKDKILMFIIGALAGAIVSTGAFYIYTSSNDKCSDSNTQMNGGQPPEMPNGQQPPDKPDGENGQPPEMPSDNNTQDSNN